MPFSSLSRDALINNSTIIDNMFITDFMPNADEIAVKVYLYGLVQCADKSGAETSHDCGLCRKQRTSLARVKAHRRNETDDPSEY